MKKIFLSIIVTLFLCPMAYSQQQVIPGLKISKSVTWSGIVIVEGDVIVMEKGRLTIEAGTKVLFKPQMDKTHSGQDKTRSELIIKGSLVVKGRMDNKVTFSSMAKNPRMGDWYGIYLGNPKQISIIDYAIIEYGYNGIMIKKSNPVIRNSQISLNYNAGILCEVKSEAKIIKNIISENGYGGIICGLGAKPILSYNLISLNEIGVVALSLSQPNLGNLKKGKNYNKGENNIFENTEYDFYNHTKLPLFAENNSWGGQANLDSRIYDSGEDTQYGVVDVKPIFRKANLDDLILVAQNTPVNSLAENTANVDLRSNNLPAQETKENNQTETQQVQKPLMASNNKSDPEETSVLLSSVTNIAEIKEEKKEAQEIDPPAIAQAQTERPFATLENKPVRPQINYDQIFLEHFLDNGSKKTLKKVAPRVKRFSPKGRVIVRTVVDKNGKVEDAQVVKGLSDYVDEIAIVAARKFEFATGKVKGIPVKFYTNILFEF